MGGLVSNSRLFRARTRLARCGHGIVQCQKIDDGPWGGAMGSSKEQKLPQPGQGADLNTSGAWHLLQTQKNSKLSRSSFLRSDVHRTQGTPM